MASGVQSPADYFGTSEHTKCEYLQKQANGGTGPVGSCCNNGGDCSNQQHNDDRWVLPGQTSNGVYTMHYQLPDGVTCERCVLQWYYQTGNSPDGYPEAFWNCADIEITPNNGATKAPAGRRTTEPTSYAEVQTLAPTTTMTSCAAGAAFIRDETDCSKYFQCSNSIAYLKQCPNGLVFNMLGYCDWPENVSCKAPITTNAPVSTKAPVSTNAPVSTKAPLSTNAPLSTKAPVSTNAPVSNNEPCNGGGFIVSNPSDCSKFFICSNGIAIPKSCTDGLVFNPQWFCDWPRNVNCGETRSPTVLRTNQPTSATKTGNPTLITKQPTVPETTSAPVSPSDYFHVCYYTNWAQYRSGDFKFLPEDIDPTLCTHINYGFGKIDASFNVVPFEWNDESTDWSKGM